ncbi:hypothetical protein THAOC_33300, partial [Thalassiosira oceanica]
DDADGRPGIPTPEAIGQRADSSDSAAGPRRNEAPPAAIEASSRRSTPQDSGYDPPPRVPTPATAEDHSASGLRRAIDNLQNAEELSSPVPSTPLNPRRTGNDPRIDSLLSPETMDLVEKMNKKFETKSTPVISTTQQKIRRKKFLSTTGHLTITGPPPAGQPRAVQRRMPIRLRSIWIKQPPELGNERQKNIADAILKTGDDDQIALALKDALEHSSVKAYVERIYGEQDSEKSAVGRVAVDGMRDLAERIRDSKHLGGRGKECRALLTTIGMALAESAELQGVSERAVLRQVFPNFSRLTAQRIMRKAGEKRKKFEEEELREFTLFEDEVRRSKYSDQEIDDLRNWMLTNDYSRDSPQAKDTIRERDLNGDLKPELNIHGLPKTDDDDRIIYKRKSKILTTLNAREMHIQMLKPESNGGFAGAYDSHGNIRFSVNSIIHYWPNWLKQMTDADKVMCGCETCLSTDDIHLAYKTKRRKIIAAAEIHLEEMDPDDSEYEEFKTELASYVAEVMPGGRHKYETCMEAAEQYGCGERVEINGQKFPPFQCMNLKCAECTKVGVKTPKFETSKHMDLLTNISKDIQYTKFNTFVRCSKHGCDHISSFDTAPKIRCSRCEGLPDGEEGKLVEKKLRTLETEPFRNFVGEDGTYSLQLKKMFAHKFHVILLGKNFKKKYRYEYAERSGLIMKITRDFAERWVPAGNNQQQFEYFNNDTSLSMEGIVVYFKPKGQTEYQTRFYSILSTEKTQDGRVVYVNTKKMLDNMFNDLEQVEDLEEGSEFELFHASANPQDADTCPHASATPQNVDPWHHADRLKRREIIDDSDGCSCQYRSGMSLYMCYKLSREEDIVYEKGIDGAGHGKGQSDGKSGGDKHYLNVEFRRNIEHNPEALIDRKRSHLTFDISGSGGFRRDLAEVCQVILSDERCGSKKGKTNKGSEDKPKSSKDFSSSTYLVRKEGEAKFDGVKMVVVGFEPGTRNGMKFHYAFRFDPELPKNQFVFSRFPCGCDGCWKQNRLPIEKRYKEPRKDCVLWPMMEIKDKTGKGTGKGHNDWRVGRFEKDNQSDERQYHAIMADTLEEMTARQVKQIVRGNFGAYFVAASNKKRKRGDDNLPYYIVKWKEAPWRATVDMETYVGDVCYTVRKGQWYCTGIWLEKLPSARNWFTMTEGGWETLVDVSKIAVANLRLLPRSEANQIRFGTRRATIKIADERGAWRISDRDHAFLVEESQSREAHEFDVKIANEVMEEEAAKINPMTWSKKPAPMKENPEKRDAKKKKSRAKQEHLIRQDGPAGWKKKSSPKKKAKKSKSPPKKRKSETTAPATGKPTKRSRRKNA